VLLHIAAENQDESDERKHEIRHTAKVDLCNVYEVGHSSIVVGHGEEKEKTGSEGGGGRRKRGFRFKERS